MRTQILSKKRLRRCASGTRNLSHAVSIESVLAVHCIVLNFNDWTRHEVHRAQAHTVSTIQIDNNRHRGFCTDKICFFLSEKLDLENAYEPHIDIDYKSLLFWRGSVTIKVMNFRPPMKTLVPNSCQKLYSFFIKSQNREANKSSVHCANIDGIDVKPGSN